MKELTLIDRAELKELTKKINNGLEEVSQGWRAIAGWATEIRERELWRAESKSWPDFCEKHGWTTRRFNQLISAEAVLLAIPQNLGTDVPTEAAARELGKVPPEKRAEVIKQAQKANGTVTAPAIKAAAVEVVTPVKEVDYMGYPIPDTAMAAWNRRQEVQDMLTQLSHIRSRLAKAREEEDAFYMSELSYQSADEVLSKLYFQLSLCKPYVVCPYCQGRGIPCKNCHQRGMVSQNFWTTMTNSRLQEMRSLVMKRKQELEKQK